MKTNASSKKSKVALIGVLALLTTSIALLKDATLRQNHEVLQSPSKDENNSNPQDVTNSALSPKAPETQLTPEQIEAATLYNDLYQATGSFFSARYQACFKKKNQILCETFYPQKNKERSRDNDQVQWKKVQKTIAKLSNKKRIQLKNRLLSQKKCSSP